MSSGMAIDLEEDAVDVANFVGTTGLRDDLQQKVGFATADALLEDIEQQQVQDALLPAFLQPGRERPQTNQALAQMQLMKEAAQEHVRWRAIRLNATDRNAAAVKSAMRASARQWVQNEELVFVLPQLGHRQRHGRARLCQQSPSGCSR